MLACCGYGYGRGSGSDGVNAEGSASHLGLGAPAELTAGAAGAAAPGAPGAREATAVEAVAAAGTANCNSSDNHGGIIAGAPAGGVARVNWSLPYPRYRSVSGGDGGGLDRGAWRARVATDNNIHAADYGVDSDSSRRVVDTVEGGAIAISRAGRHGAPGRDGAEVGMGVTSQPVLGVRLATAASPGAVGGGGGYKRARPERKYPCQFAEQDHML